MRTTLVTGASGFAGGHLLQSFRAHEAARVVAWEGPDGMTRTTSEGCGRLERITWRRVDVLEPDAVAQALANDPPDEVYHLAGAAQVAQSWNRVETTLAVNVLGTHRLLEALRSVAPRARVLLVCSGLVYRQTLEALTEDSPIGPTNPYGLSKLAEEQLGVRAWKDDGQPVIVARSFNHVGPGQSPHFFASSFARQIAMIEAGRVPPVILVGNLDARRDVTDVRDTVRAYRALMDAGAPGQAYNVCSGRTYRVGDTLEALIARARVSVDVQVDVDRLRPNDNPLVLGSPDRLMRATGWRPTIPMKQTLEDLLEYWRELVAGDAST
jgi:GDP-4-dehydro-6-deoxy-D-mannose reductase